MLLCWRSKHTQQIPVVRPNAEQKSGLLARKRSLCTLVHSCGASLRPKRSEEKGVTNREFFFWYDARYDKHLYAHVGAGVALGVILYWKPRIDG